MLKRLSSILDLLAPELLNTVIKTHFQLSSPLFRTATGKQLGPVDIEQYIQTIPNLVVNVPGVGDVDVSKASNFFFSKTTNRRSHVFVPNA